MNLCGLPRFGLTRDEAALLLDGILARTAGNKLRVGWVFDRELLADFLDPGLRLAGPSSRPPCGGARRMS